MLALSFVVNLAVLAPVLVALMRATPAMDQTFGGDTPARRILAALYGTIALASVAGLLLLVSSQKERALALGVGLFAFQIVYKLMTLPLLGLSHPVVKANLLVIVLHAATLAALFLHPV